MLSIAGCVSIELEQIIDRDAASGPRLHVRSKDDLKLLGLESGRTHELCSGQGSIELEQIIDAASGPRLHVRSKDDYIMMLMKITQ